MMGPSAISSSIVAPTAIPIQVSTSISMSVSSGSFVPPACSAGGSPRIGRKAGRGHRSAPFAGPGSAF
jgi:hypothetical protein